MGECKYPYPHSNVWYRKEAGFLTAIFICPTYFLLNAFGECAYKVGVSCPQTLSQYSSSPFQGEFGVPPASHAEDVAFYFPVPFVNFAIAPSPMVLFTFFNLYSGHQDVITTFGKAFAESFLNFAIFLNPNVKWDLSNITPPWGLWDGNTEMLFNVTESWSPDIHSVTTSTAVLERCKWVFLFFLFPLEAVVICIAIAIGSGRVFLHFRLSDAW